MELPGEVIETPGETENSIVFKVYVVLTEFNNFLLYYKYISVIFADYSAHIHLFLPWSNIVHALPRPSAVFLQSCRMSLALARRQWPGSGTGTLH